jgi:translation initiation factor 3 subunit K
MIGEFFIQNKDDEIAKLIKAKGWRKMEDNYVFVANHEESIKTKNIVEKIKFEGLYFQISD